MMAAKGSAPVYAVRGPGEQKGMRDGAQNFRLFVENAIRRRV
jgi:hypothetical protein